ncbi:MAG: phosphoenolpyruvate--protein phosphotransferase [Ruminococcus sp.]|nr:phosphoenolpyruvate--protein phosphotransferase [Ruminococcus sp.]
MRIFKGKGVYGAIAIGKVKVFSRKDIIVHRTHVSDTVEEIKRFEQAKKLALSQLDEIYEKAVKEVGQANAQIFEIHKMMLDDEDFNESIENIIKAQSVNAEYAIAITSDNFSEMFSAMDNSYMQARAADVKDISNRLISALTEAKAKPESETEEYILLADDLAPSETVSLPKDNLAAFVTSKGSANSHTAILARSMNIPAVIGVGDELLDAAKDGNKIIVDGHSGEVYLKPDPQTKEHFEKKKKEDSEKKALLLKLKGKENITKDGRKIDIFANIGSSNEAGAALACDAGGIGLFRSEFLYLESSDYPTEDKQFNAYKKVLECMGGKTVIIRTLDIGADKQADYFALDKEENPALGLRAIRLCLEKEDVFKTQLRALYRAAVYGKLGIMFPMIASVWELENILKICDEVANELEAEGIPYGKSIMKGIMIETPAAAIISDKLAKLVDFFSIGTNDLIQYTLACDRQNAKLERFCAPDHEAVLRLIELTAKNAHENSILVGICGELAADTSLTEWFIKIGIDELSVSPAYVLPLRDKVRSLDLSRQ